MAKKKAAEPERLALGNVRILILENAYPGCWGKGKTWDEAYANAHKPKYYQAYICHEDTYVYEGIRPMIHYPSGYEPVMIRDVKPPARKVRAK
jgi:hypothetical protein